MSNCSMRMWPVYRPGLPISCTPVEAGRLLRFLGRSLAAAAVVVVLTASLVWATQQTTQVIASVVSPAMTVTMSRQSETADRDLQVRVDAYLADLTQDGNAVEGP